MRLSYIKENFCFIVSYVCFNISRKIFMFFLKHEMGYCHPTAVLEKPACIFPFRKLYMYEDTNIYSGFKFIISNTENAGRIIFKKHSGAAEGLTIITGNHQRECGFFFKEISGGHKNDIERDVVVEEDVWIGANVTILAGVHVGRGATVGAGAVCHKSIPPYAIVMGNPAKVVGFNYNPEEIIEHEKALYPENERLSIELLQNNYDKYFVKKINDIKQFTKL